MQDLRKRNTRMNSKMGSIFGFYKKQLIRKLKYEENYKGKGEPKLEEKNSKVEIMRTGIRISHFK